MEWQSSASKSVQSKIELQLQCKDCDWHNSIDSYFCNSCGLDLQNLDNYIKVIKCNSCNAAWGIDSNFCGHCGISLKNLSAHDEIMNSMKEICMAQEELKKVIRSFMDIHQELHDEGNELLDAVEKKINNITTQNEKDIVIKISI